MDSVFNTLNGVNVNEHTEKKGKLTYLSWAWAWGEVKKRYPDAQYTIYESENGCIYHTDGKTAWVKTGVTINGLEHIEYLPVMDNYNKSIPIEKITSFSANTAIQRSLTKAIARHGLGLYIYAGEDLPEIETDDSKPLQNSDSEFTAIVNGELCEHCGKPITDYGKIKADAIIASSTKKFGQKLCYPCGKLKQYESTAEQTAKG